jgi:hypothetical protein
MHIAAKGIVRRSVYAAFSGIQYAAFWDKGQLGLIVARRDGATLYVQGDDALSLERELNAACDANPDSECDAVDRVLDRYSTIENWDTFETTRCYPSSDLMLLNYY